MSFICPDSFHRAKREEGERELAVSTVGHDMVAGLLLYNTRDMGNRVDSRGVVLVTRLVIRATELVDVAATRDRETIKACLCQDVSRNYLFLTVHSGAQHRHSALYIDLVLRKGASHSLVERIPDLLADPSVPSYQRLRQ